MTTRGSEPAAGAPAQKPTSTNAAEVPDNRLQGIQRGLQGMYDGTGEDAEDAFASLERELGIAEQA
jgi:hypothetical protein